MMKMRIQASNAIEHLHSALEAFIFLLKILKIDKGACAKIKDSFVSYPNPLG
jgi:hypothetical protein